MPFFAPQSTLAAFLRPGAARSMDKKKAGFIARLLLRTMQCNGLVSQQPSANPNYLHQNPKTVGPHGGQNISYNAAKELTGKQGDNITSLSNKCNGLVSQQPSANPNYLHPAGVSPAVAVPCG